MPGASELLQSLARLIRQKREMSGISQTMLAEKSGLHRTYINNIERGNKNISIESIKKIADALGTTASELLREAELESQFIGNSLKILLIEDNPADVFMFRRCLKAATIPTELQVLESGKAAMDHIEYLDSRQDLHAMRSLPDIIFLDLNLPGRSGHEILHEIKKRESLKHIPVIILTTSENPLDIKKSYSSYANSFMTKPVDPKEYQDSIEEVIHYWFNTTSLPKT